ncbi:MAG: hypothetical protein GTN99_08510 [Candidatus Dadabacteria bacterium]|nr:hypothetical protein [Candidatus Dadabacteria bacterium]
MIKAKFNSAMPVRNGLALSPDGTKVAAAEGVYHEDKHLHETLIEVWDVASGSTKPIFKYDKRNNGIVVGVWNILFSADSAMIAFDTQSAGESGITLMGLDGNTTFAKSGFKSYWMRAADYFDAKNYLATGDEQRNLVVWDIKTKGIGFYNKLPEVVESVSFSNDGSMLAAGIADSTIQVFSTEK